MTSEGGMCECNHYDKYTDMKGYTTMMQNALRESREENAKLRQVVFVNLQQVEKLQTVNQAFQMKLGKAAVNFKKEFDDQQTHYIRQMEDMRQQCIRRVHNLGEHHHMEMVQAITIIEALKDKIRTLEQKNVQDLRSIE